MSIATKKIKVRPAVYDLGLLFPVLLLIGMGIVMVYSASSALALKKMGSDVHFLKKQAFFSLLGILALVICSHVPFRLYRSLTYPLLFLAIGLLAVVQVAGLVIFSKRELPVL